MVHCICGGSFYSGNGRYGDVVIGRSIYGVVVGRYAPDSTVDVIHYSTLVRHRTSTHAF